MGQILPFTHEPTAFDPGTVALAIRAYDKALVELGSPPELVREVIAKHIIQHLAAGERDPRALCQRALASAGIPAGPLNQPPLATQTSCPDTAESPQANSPS